MTAIPRKRILRRTLPILAAVLLGLSLLGLAAAKPASAAGVTTTITDAQTNLCLDGADNPHMDQCSGLASQQWSIAPAGDPNVIITNVQNGQCLDTAYQNPAVSPVAEVTTDQCNGSPSQEWYAEPDPAQDGGLVFMNVLTGMVLDSNYGAVYANSANGGTYQNWTVSEFPGLPPIAGNSPRLMVNTTLTDAQTGLCLGDNTGTVQTDQCGGLASQQWSITAAGNPMVVITNVQTGQCLDSSYQNPASPSDGAIFTSACSGGGLSRFWFLTNVGPGDTVVLMNMQTGRLLDSNYAGAVYGHTANGGNYQSWTATELPQFPQLAAVTLATGG